MIYSPLIIRINKTLSLTLLLLILVMQSIIELEAKCHGRFVNPISDICWSCIMPISIGKAATFGKGSIPKKRDRNNPYTPVCMCTKNNIPTPGITIGFWEPVRLVDVTREPYCMVNLGGVSLGSDPGGRGGFKKHSRTGSSRSHYSFYHVHYYAYPLIYWLEIITDFACLEPGSFDLAYMSEFDVTWDDEKLQILLNPEALLFANPIAQASCAIDCAAATLSMPIDSMFWCAGCLGNIYPFSGANADHMGGVQNSSLLTYRILAKMHRVGLAKATATTDASIDGAICRKRTSFLIPKSQYKLQMVYPRTSSKGLGCWPIGLSDMLYSSFKEYPNDGSDWGYLIWRKTNCCLF